MIYAIRAVGTSYIKFGYTKDHSLKARLETLQTGSPFDLQPLAFGPGDAKLEQLIHMRLRRANAHHRGEWFIDCPEAQAVMWEINESQKLADQARAAKLAKHYTRKGRLGRVLQYAERFTESDPAAPAETPSVSRVA
jgi:hypothetical protein